jgi:arginine/lysine/ornithine decarboxylase
MAEDLLEQLEQYCRTDAYPLHMPGHKRQMAHFEQPFAIDITEIDGFDNLHHAQGILREAQERAAQLYGAEETFYLINGSTCGILAAVAAQTLRGDRILMARNCHKAVYHAVFLNGLQATYLYPEMNLDYGINGAIRPEQVQEALERDPEIRVILITSPTYDGVVSDIRRIAELAHRAGAVLIVDEAHGAHFRMHPYFPVSALECGADIVINSLHKTMPSLTQTALLHVQGSRVDREKLHMYLGIYQTSSPSYVLMAGMDACVRMMQEQGLELFERFTDRLNRLRDRLQPMKTLHLVDGTEAGLQAFDFDRSKVLIAVPKGAKLTGPALAQLLRETYHLEVEMAAEQYVTAILTVCDTEEGYVRLEQALLEVDAALTEEKKCQCACDSTDQAQGVILPHNECVLTMEAAWNAQAKAVPLLESGGQISAEFAYLYPPGIPFVVPGERIPEDLPAQLNYYQQIGLNLQGMSDETGSYIRIVE